MQVAQPINLTNYLMWFNEQVDQNSSYAKRVLKQGYSNQIERIQKSKNMVTRKRYLVISKPMTQSPKRLHEARDDGQYLESETRTDAVGLRETGR
nr:hypothetical protein [Planococcus glaciei]